MTNTNSEKNIVNDFLNAMATTATEHEFEKHMELISKKITVYGVPGFETVSYDDWFRQCEKEFNEKLIKHVSYEGLKIIKATDLIIMFKTIEHIESTDNKKSATAVEMVIIFEQDEVDGEIKGVWRVTQEKILSDKELTTIKTMD